jgi:hypothetical protein
MKIAGDLCVYTNHSTVCELLDRKTDPEAPKPTLGYWNVRGKCSQIKHLLAHVVVDYDLKEYIPGDAPDHSRQDWLDAKFTLGLDFPNLPYYTDG